MKNIIFDIGMVLIDFHWRTTMQKLGIPENVIDEISVRNGNNMLISAWKRTVAVFR